MPPIQQDVVRERTPAEPILVFALREHEPHVLYFRKNQESVVRLRGISVLPNSPLNDLVVRRDWQSAKSIQHDRHSDLSNSRLNDLVVRRDWQGWKSIRPGHRTRPDEAGRRLSVPDVPVVGRPEGLELVVEPHKLVGVYKVVAMVGMLNVEAAPNDD